MTCHIFRPSKNIFFSVLGLCGIVGFSVSAVAQVATKVAPGCNVNVWNALEAKAQAQVAYDTAVTRELINKPDSVLTLTCFDQAAAISAKNGGAVFAGDFTPQLQSIMPVAALPAPPAPQFNCTGIGDLWNEIVNQGVDPGVPYATFDDLMNGTLPTVPAPNTVGTDFRAAWVAANAAGIFGNLKNAVTTLQPPTPINFAGAKSSCDVLLSANIIPGPCP